MAKCTYIQRKKKEKKKSNSLVPTTYCIYTGHQRQKTVKTKAGFMQCRIPKEKSCNMARITENITSLFHNMEQGCKYPICNLLHFFLHRLTFLTLFHFLLGCLLHLGLLILGHPLCLLLITILVFIIIIIVVIVVIITIIVAFLNPPFCWGLFTSTFGILPFL